MPQVRIIGNQHIHRPAAITFEIFSGVDSKQHHMYSVSRASVAANRKTTCVGPTTAPACALRAAAQGLCILSLVSQRAQTAVQSEFSMTLKAG
jgi:hypothetical protein